ncbi:TPA: septation ring formation regulator EzrA [Bacillus mobilis]|nr:septation ring formation regulator EzrA [Bacillus thuringiensis]SME41997.1 hypothetical protein BACERE00177_04326 [Bacillus mobilis]HDR7518063.1 septation ring formation regulator EzrA [Bacillus mobilis]HDR7550794.1 septation ring formation regulator EzrA [Bacillus mobilis]HDR7555890.1 septation ring formation regulator EzrA [Bacillus mobilis]
MMKVAKKKIVPLLLVGGILAGGGIVAETAYGAETEVFQPKSVEYEIQMMKDSGMTLEQVKQFVEISKEGKEFFEKDAKIKAENDLKEIDELKTTHPEEAKELYSKIDDPAYSQNELNGLVALAGSALGTKGDVLVSYEINSGSSSIGVGHTAIVSKDSSRTIESFAKSWSPTGKDGVQYYPNTWKGRSKVYGLWVKGANNTKYLNAASYAQGQIGKGYNWSFFDKNRTDKFYCSQLAWRSWKNQGIDIDNVTWDTVVTPMELVKSSNTTIFYSN